MQLFESLEERRLFAVALVGTQLQVTGGAGNDVIRVRQQDAATIRVEDNGVVTLFADASVNTILVNANAGNDTVQVISTAALPLTEPATVNGGDGNDNLTGGGGADVMTGGAGNDVMAGGAGNDNLDGGTGSNTLSGGDGNDFMTAGTSADSFDGGAGTDTVSYSTRTVAINVSLDNVANDGQTTILTLPPPSLPIIIPEADNVRDSVENVTTGSGNDTIVASALVSANNTFNGGSGNDRLEGRGGNDVLLGSSGDDVLLGGSGNDNLQGASGNDQLLGGSGNDAMLGGTGNDVLVGGSGADSMRGEDGNDVIVASDGFADTLIDGGAGFDIADVDAADPAPITVEVLT
jgi:Ca2+-binding RTX toxin-like protein